MTDKGRTRNEISSGNFFSTVVQGRDINIDLPPHVHPALAGLPNKSTVFTGRDTDLKRLMEMLDPASSGTVTVRLSAVGGLGGVGKTELVLQAAHAALRNDWFPGGALFVHMFGYDPQRRVDASTALEGMLRAAGIPGEHIPSDVQDRSRLFSSVMAAYAAEGRDVLVVIDNVSSSAQVRPLLPAGGRAVVTSRHTLADLDARLLELGTLTPSAGVDLLAGQLRLSCGTADTRIADDPDHALSIARLCAGLPLALRIVAALLAAHPARPLSSMAADLRDARTRLDEIRYTRADGEVAVRSAFDLSYRQIDPQQARTFRLLTLNPGPEISSEVASAMTAQDQRSIRLQLEELARAHLIEPGSSYGRWRMHDLVRLYADNHGHTHARDDHRDEALDRLLAYFLDKVEAVLPAHMSRRPEAPAPERLASHEDVWAWLDTEHGSLVAAVDLAYQRQRYTQAIYLSLYLSWYLQKCRHLDDWRSVAQTGLLAARELPDRQAEARVMISLGTVLRQLGQFDGAITADRQAAGIFRELGDRQGEVHAVGNMGISLSQVRRFDEALTTCREVVNIFRELGDRHGEGRALVNLGSVLHEVQQFDEAMTIDRQAADIFRELSDRYGEGLAIGSLGTVMRDMQRLHEAIDAHQQHLVICRELQHPYVTAQALENLGMDWTELRQFTEAVTAYREAAEIFRELGEHDHEMDVLKKLEIVQNLMVE